MYVTRVEKDPDSGEFAITFPQNVDFLEALNLQDGELIVWEISEDQIVIKKKMS